MLNKINIGIEKDSGTGDTLRQGAVKINNNFEEVYNVLGLNGQSGDGNVAFVDTEQTLTNKTIQSSKTDSIINYDPINIPNSIKELYPDNHLLKATEDPFINTSYGSFSNYFFDEILPSISPDFENDLKVKFGIDSFENFINTLSAENQQLFIDKVIINKFYNNLVSKTHYDIDLADFFQSIASKLNLTKMKDWLVNTKKIYTRDATDAALGQSSVNSSTYTNTEGTEVTDVLENKGLYTGIESGELFLTVNPRDTTKFFFDSNNSVLPISYASDPNTGASIAMNDQCPFTQILNSYTLMPMCYFHDGSGSGIYAISNTIDKKTNFFSFVDTDIAVENWQSLYSVDGIFDPSLMPNDSLLFPENVAHVQSRKYGSKEILYITESDPSTIERDGEFWQSKTIKKIDTSKIKIVTADGGMKYIVAELRDIESVTYLFRSIDSTYAPFGMVSFSPEVEDELYYTEYTTSSIASNIYKINLVFDGSENQVYFEGPSKTKTINSNTDNPFYTIPASENLFQFGPSFMTGKEFNVWTENSKLYGTVSYINIVNNPPTGPNDYEYITLKINLTDSFSDPVDSFERLTKESTDNFSFGHVIDNQFYIYDMKQGKLYNYNTPSEEYQLDDVPILTEDDNLWIYNRMYLIDKDTNNILYTRKEEPLSTTNSTYLLIQQSELENVKLYNSLFNSGVSESDIINNFISFVNQTGVNIDEYSFDMIISNWTDEAITDKSFFNGLSRNGVIDSLEDLTNTLMEYIYFLRLLESTNLDENIQYTVNTPALLTSMEQFFHIDTFSNFVNENFINNNNQSAIGYLHEYNILKNNLIDSSLIVNSNILLPTITKGSNKISKISISNGDSFIQKNKITLQPNESFKSNLKGKYEIMDSVDPLISADCYFNGTNINIITVSDDISETISDSDKIVITVDGSEIKVTNKFSTQKEIIIFQK